ncbi:reverse transcriptase domain-containing protein [Tanacetum coccineum]|uniref:Reverse transcriptase domain-containing protein n=1 Tax=Tanacetum coccineum TaxID=301880 RepID=A0ABQ5GN40_9ASTR
MTIRPWSCILSRALVWGMRELLRKLSCADPAASAIAISFDSSDESVGLLLCFCYFNLCRSLVVDELLVLQPMDCVWPWISPLGRFDSPDETNHRLGPLLLNIARSGSRVNIQRPSFIICWSFLLLHCYCLARGSVEEERLDLYQLAICIEACIPAFCNTTTLLLLVHLRILCQFILRVWMHQIRLILDLRLEMYHLDWVTLRGEHDNVVRHFVVGVLLHYPTFDHRHTITSQSLGDSSERPLHSSPHSTGPSCKRCRSLVDSVPSSTPVMGSLTPNRADLLPPRKRFRDSYSFKASIEENTEIDPIETEVDMGVELGIGDRNDFEDHVLRLTLGMFSIVRIVGIELLRDAMLDIETGVVKVFVFTCRFHPEGVSVHVVVIAMIREGDLEEALAAHEATRAANALETKNQSQNGSDGDNGNGGNGNGGNGNGRNENPDENGRGDRPVARECTYQDFMKCQPLNFKGTEGVVGLIRTEAAFAMSWRELMKLMTEVYCPRNEIQKMETELWNLTMKNNDLTAYTQRFQELTMMCTKMVPEEEDRVEKFIGGLPDNIQGNVIAAEPTRLQDAVRIANNLMDQKLKGYAVRNAENKRRLNNNYRNNRRQQPPHKRQNIGGVSYTTKDSVLLSIVTVRGLDIWPGIADLL